ncbi:MAG: putative 4-hydroxybenzoate polyprenyltransferase [Pirellula sp.]|jgi:4-hydroxybenzoate polyprenyltransferase|nr:putative 4-hydroxybenzoate polyprenyltransferase [Pirellula sp.]
MLERVRRYGELIRFSHTIFALPFALLASWWAWVVPSMVQGVSVAFRWRDLAGILLCMVTARSFAMAANRLLDEKFDADNPRTAGRHLPAGLLGRNEVLGFTLACAAAFIASTLLFLPNWLPLVCSLPVLLFLAGYSLGKRFTWLVHFWLGVALMLAPVCAWIALRGSVVIVQPADLLPSVVLGGCVCLWVAGFDVIYACQDFAFDRERGLHSIPARFGVRGALSIAKGLHLLMLGLAMAMSFWFPQLSLGWIYRLALGGVAILLVWEHTSVSERSLDRMQLAFFQLNAIISLVFLAAGGIDAMLR